MLKKGMSSALIATAVVATLSGPLTVCAATIPQNEATASQVVVTESESKPTDANRDAFRLKMEKARQKWSQLTKEQKNQVYQIMKQEQAVKFEKLDKLVELGLMEKDDAKQLKERKAQHLKDLMATGEFPMGRCMRGRQGKETPAK